jgi:hypothetical protein
MARRASWAVLLVIGLICAVGISTSRPFTAKAAEPAPVALSWNGPYQVISSADSTGFLIQCTSVQTCVVMSHDGYEATFNPAAPAGPQAIPMDLRSSSVVALTCPSDGECLSLDSVGYVVLFSPGAQQGLELFEDSAEPTKDLSCPTSDECAVVDGTGSAWVFNPLNTNEFEQHGVVDPPESITERPPPLEHVACVTSETCVAFEASKAFSFNPQSTNMLGTLVGTVSATGPAACLDGAFDGCLIPAGTELAQSGFNGSNGWSTYSIGATSSLTSVTCATDYFCAAADSQGNVFEGDPLNRDWISAQAAPDEVESLSCPSAQMCVAITQGGNVYVGTPPSTTGGGGTTTTTTTTTATTTTTTATSTTATTTTATTTTAATTTGSGGGTTSGTTGGGTTTTGTGDKTEIALTRVATRGSTAQLRVSCALASHQICVTNLTLSVHETHRSGRGSKTRDVVIGRTSVKLEPGTSATVRIPLNETGKRLIEKQTLHAKLVAAVSGKTVATEGATFEKLRSTSSRR